MVTVNVYARCKIRATLVLEKLQRTMPKCTKPLCASVNSSEAGGKSFFEFGGAYA